ncbi:MAG TPA: 4-alpha-glucanotransferase [Longimicrobiales bacterium]|nr:4-alpha-glucanotransferase [Longimicrobiales bacterium]
MTSPGGLHTLARLHGVQTSYRANDGATVSASPDALMAALRALRVPLESSPGIQDLVRHRRRQLAERVIEPVAVAWRDDAAAVGSFQLRLPARLRDAAVRVTVGLEEGGEATWTVDASSLEVAEEIEADGRAFAALRVPLRTLPPGYHDLIVEAGRGRWEALLIVAPKRAAGWDVVADRPAWGVFAPLYALRERARPGAPDFGTLDRLAARVAARGGSVVGTLPLLAAFLDRPYEPGPYAPVSRLFWNELYTDPVAAPGADALFDDDRARLAGDGDPAGRWFDAGGAMAAKRPALEALARRFFAEEGDPELAAFRARNPLADDYARFRAITERRGEWGRWPDRLRARDIRAGDYDEDVARYHLYVQWLAERQLAEATERARDRGVSLYLDLPMGVHPAGYDVWRERALFARGTSAGAPPDALGPEGQDWGFPPLHPEASRMERHAYFIASIRHHLRFASVLRIDHVMQLHRMYWVPGGDPREGVYVRYPADELYAILCLESRRARTVIVGEDLGTVPTAVRRDMKGHGLAGMYVAQFELQQRTAGAADAAALVPRAVPRGAVASVGTHDTPMFAGWLRAEQGLRDRLARGLGVAESEGEGEGEDEALGVLATLHEHMGSSRAGLVLATMEDLWLEPEPQNVPGTTGDRNWRRRSAAPLESLDEGRAAGLLERLDEARRSSG